MRYDLKVLLLSVGIFTASIAASIDTVLAESVTQIQKSSQERFQHQNNHHHHLIARGNRDKEINAFARSDYDYWDARVLSDYWGQSVGEAKARIGRKILWGAKDVAILEQFLVDARVQALRTVGSSSVNRNPYRFYTESKYNYDDAVDLAKFWGDRSPLDAKLRIERNLIMGNDEIVEQALQFARQ